MKPDQDQLTAPKSIIIVRPRCPSCRSPDLRTNRTLRDGGTPIVVRYIACRSCGHRFKGIVQ